MCNYCEPRERTVDIPDLHDDDEFTVWMPQHDGNYGRICIQNVKTDGIAMFEISFCPMCGRNLKEVTP